MDTQKTIQPGWVQHSEPFEYGQVKPTDRFEPVPVKMRSVLLESGFRLDENGHLIGEHTIQDEGRFARVYRQRVGLGRR